MNADDIFKVVLAAIETVNEHFPDASIEVKTEIADMLVQSVLG